MANQKVTELTELTSASDDDLLYIVNDPGGSPASRRITVANFLANCLKLVGGVITGDITLSADVVLGSTNAVYWGGKTTEGSWRRIRSGNDLVDQRYESGNWVEKARVEA